MRPDREPVAARTASGMGPPPISLRTRFAGSSDLRRARSFVTVRCIEWSPIFAMRLCSPSGGCPSWPRQERREFTGGPRRKRVRVVLASTGWTYTVHVTRRDPQLLLPLAMLLPLGVAMALVGVRGEIATEVVALVLALTVVAGGVLAGRIGGVAAALIAAVSFDFFFTRALPVVEDRQWRRHRHDGALASRRPRRRSDDAVGP